MKGLLTLLSIFSASFVFSVESAYDPWYTGSLLSTSGKTVPPGKFNLQPYLYVLSNYGIYNSSFKLKNSRNTLALSTELYIQAGLNRFLDCQLALGTNTK
jgi:hypothetical protein